MWRISVGFCDLNRVSKGSKDIQMFLDVCKKEVYCGGVRKEIYVES